LRCEMPATNILDHGMAQDISSRVGRFEYILHRSLQTVRRKKRLLLKGM
jgi:uncharacterized protein (DUF1786 family)